ncbi:MAG: M20/M25/M40 family metallo-hydrolase [Acidobacteria bacterium]|nr:M20/M25/M40 family metallo-hydrolase [Acidobacteriota bacterium]
MASPVEAARKHGGGKADPRLQKSVTGLAAARTTRGCTGYFHKHRSWINEQHLELCRIAAPTFLEEKRAQWMEAQFRLLGWDARMDRAGNVIAYADSNRQGPFVALTAHLDTVLAPRQPEEVHIDREGHFHGPGVSDNGPGLAALLAFAAAWKASPPLADSRASLLLVANVGEEGEGNLNGMRFLCRQSQLGHKIRSYLVLDGPGTDHITHRARASRRFEVAVTGPGGHSWSDHGNANPVHAVSRAIHCFTEELFVTGNGIDSRSSFNFGTIEGGVSVNSIPTMARAKLDVRSEESHRLEEMSRLLATVVERAVEIENSRASGGRVQAKVREIGARPGGRLWEGAAILTYLQAVDACLGIRAHLDCASTDANIPLSLGMEALSIGAGGQGGGAHTFDEWFDPEGRDLGLERILLTLCLLLTA